MKTHWYSRGYFGYLVLGALGASAVTYLYVCLMRFSTVWSRLTLYIDSDPKGHTGALRVIADAMLGRGGGILVVPGVIALGITIYGVRRRSWWKSVILFAVCLFVASCTLGSCTRGNSYFNKRSTLRLRVVNDALEPVAGAMVRGSLHIRESPLADAKSGSFHGTTDEDGRFQHETRGVVTVNVLAMDYYEKLVEFGPPALDAGEVVVTLESAPEAVPMSEFKISKYWDEEKDSVEFLASFAPVRGIYDSIVDDPDEAEIRFSIRKIGETIYEGQPYGELVTHNLKQWEVTVTGLKGWNVAPGPAYTQDRNDPRMRFAPTDGYRDRLSFLAAESPTTLYVSSENGRRFGKLWQIDFRDFSRYGVFQYQFRAFGLIQREDTGTTSLRELTPGLEILKRGIQSPPESGKTAARGYSPANESSVLGPYRDIVIIVLALVVSALGVVLVVSITMRRKI